MPAPRKRVTRGFDVTVGDRVRFSGHGPSIPNTGYITSINGAYIMVMVHTGARYFDVECLENEIIEIIPR